MATSHGDQRMTPALASDPRANRCVPIAAILGVVLVAVVIVCLTGAVVPSARYAILGLVQPDSAQVSASSGGGTVASHTIHDHRTVSDLYTRINGLHATPVGKYCVLPTGYIYYFRFTRSGTLIESATTVGTRACYPSWQIERGGWAETHLDLTGAATQVILSEARLPPLPGASSSAASGVGE